MPCCGSRTRQRPFLLFDGRQPHLSLKTIDVLGREGLPIADRTPDAGQDARLGRLADCVGVDNEHFDPLPHAIELHRLIGRESHLPTRTIFYLSRETFALTAGQLGGPEHVPSLPLANSLGMYVEHLRRFAHQVELHVNPLTAETQRPVSRGATDNSTHHHPRSGSRLARGS